jgi:protoporphyrinogen oxidase
MARMAIIGSGAMGLAAAHHAIIAGHNVTVFEADRVPGGMAAHFDFDGLSIERFYHFVCKADEDTFALMRDLGIADAIKWRPTSMGYFIDGRHYPWGDPVSLLTFPLMGPIDKFRYGLHVFRTTRQVNWSSLENESAEDWIVRGCGRRTYDLLWKRLLELKFYEYASGISAAWIGTRIRRIGTSRKSIFREELGYIEGGSQTLVDALVQSIVRKGGILRLGTAVQEIITRNGKAEGVRAEGQVEAFDAVISTVPTPLVSKLVPTLPQACKDRYDAIPNIGVVCVLLKLRKPVTKHFWLNINDPAVGIPGLVEFSNLRPLRETVVYGPYYMPTTNPKFAEADDTFVTETFACVRKLNPAIGEGDLIASHVGRLRHAQPVCGPGFSATIPSVQTPIAGLQIADTCFYYPEDRGISESVRYGKLMAQAVRNPSIWRYRNASAASDDTAHK